MRCRSGLAKRRRRCAVPPLSRAPNRRSGRTWRWSWALQGRFQEAETIAGGDVSPAEAAANVAYLRQMLAQQSDWKKSKRGSPLVPTTGS